MQFNAKWIRIELLNFMLSKLLTVCMLKACTIRKIEAFLNAYSRSFIQHRCIICIAVICVNSTATPSSRSGTFFNIPSCLWTFVAYRNCNDLDVCKYLIARRLLTYSDSWELDLAEDLYRKEKLKKIINLRIDYFYLFFIFLITALMNDCKWFRSL